MLAVLVLYACATKPNLLKNETIVESNPKLIFLNYAISKNENNQKSIEFIDKKIVDGKLRNKGSKYINSGTVGDLVCVQLNQNKIPIAEQTIANPLIKHIESTTDSLTFKKHTAPIKQRTLNLRIQLHAATKFIKLEEIIDSLQTRKPLITSSIK